MVGELLLQIAFWVGSSLEHGNLHLIHGGGSTTGVQDVSLAAVDRIFVATTVHFQAVGDTCKAASRRFY